MSDIKPPLPPSTYDGVLMDKGKVGEEIIFEFLKREKGVKTVWDVRKEELWQAMDVDFAQHYYTDTWRYVEAKTDHYLGKSGRVLFEIMRINHTCDPVHAAQLGWSARTTAHVLFVYAPTIEKIYEFNMAELRKSFQRFTELRRKVTNPSAMVNVVLTDAIKTTLNVLIPEKYCTFTIHELPQPLRKAA